MAYSRVSTRRMVKAFYRSGWRRPFWLLAFIGLALVAGRIALNPLLERSVRRFLDERGSFAAADFTDTQIFLFPPSVTFIAARVEGADGGGVSAKRIELHFASLREVWSEQPRLRIRLVEPAIQFPAATTGSHGLRDWWLAMPAARLDAVSIERGAIAVAHADATQPTAQSFLQQIDAELQGLSTVAAGNAGAWELWGDGRMDGRDPVHVSVRVEQGGAWQGTLSIRQVAIAGSVAGNGLGVDAKLSGSAGQVRGAGTATWTGLDQSVERVAERVQRLTALAGAWPLVEMRLTKMVPSPGNTAPSPGNTGQSVDIAFEGVVTDVGGHARDRLRPIDTPALMIAVVRLGNQAVLPAPAGMATLQAEPAEASTEP